MPLLSSVWMARCSPFSASISPRKASWSLRTAGIDETVGPLAGGKRRGHRKHRRHADAAGQQHDGFDEGSSGKLLLGVLT